MKDLFDRWGMIIMVFLVVKKTKPPQQKHVWGKYKVRNRYKKECSHVTLPAR